MSYLVTLRRPAGPPIQAGEVIQACADDSRFTPQGSSPDDSLVLLWLPEGEASPTPFVLSRGEITVTTPSHAALGALQDLAGKLGARVFGEEGEELTDVALPRTDPAGCGPLAGLAFLATLAALGWWLF